VGARKYVTIRIQTFPDVRSLCYAISDIGNFQEVKYIKTGLFWNAGSFFFTEMKTEREEGGWRIMRGENTGGYTVMLRTIRFQSAGVWIWTGRRWVYMYLGMFTYVYADPTCVKFDLVPDLGERKYCITRVVCLYTYMQNGRREIMDVGNKTLSMPSAPSELAKFVMILMRHNRVWKPQLWYILHQFLKKKYFPVSHTFAECFIVKNADKCVWGIRNHQMKQITAINECTSPHCLYR